MLPDAFYSRKRASSLTLPWEEGFASLVLGAPEQEAFKQPHLELHSDLRCDDVSGTMDPVQTASQAPPIVKRRRIRILGRVARDPRDEAIRKWALTVDEFKGESQTGRLADAAAPLGPGGLAAQLDHCFAHKATATILKRWYAARRFARWRRSHSDQSPFWNEQAVYEYLQHLHVTHAPATRGLQLIEAVGFMQTTFGIDGAKAILSSGRCRGLALKMTSWKRVLKQAPPLSILMIKHLETLTSSADRLVDRVAAGNFLFCCLASSRFSDVQRSGGLRLDVDENNNGLIRAEVLEHKTYQRNKANKQLLPLIALTRGLEPHSWALAWIKARSEAGLPLDASAALLNPVDDSTFSSVPVTTGVATTWLRDLLSESACLPQEVSAVSTHSLKTTLLTWAARYGMTVDDRRLMGHHLDPHVRSVATYNRDLLVNIHVKIAVMLKDMRKGTFDPEASVGQRIAEASLDDLFKDKSQPDRTSLGDDDGLMTPTEPAFVEDVALPEEGHPDELEHLLETPVVSATVQPPSITSSESEEPSSGEEPASVDLIGLIIEDGYDLFAHVQSSCAHVAKSPASRFLCGRQATWRYELSDPALVARLSLCSQCVKVMSEL